MASPQSVLQSSEEKTNGFKLMRLIVDGGTEALRKVFLTIHPGNLQTVLSTHHHTLNHLKTTRIITKPQWNKLYPNPRSIPTIDEFDITLLVILLRNICTCGISPPSTGWNDEPNPTDNSREANIVRIKLFRNNFFGHVAGTGVTTLDFEARWAKVSSALVSLGISPTEIDRLKSEECGEEEVNRVKREWSKKDREIMLKLDGFEKILNESLQEFKPPSGDILNECLHWCNFETEIQSFHEKYTKGTREWVFEQVSAWLNDTSSNKRAFIISAQPGMGKSTIAAVICKRFPEQFAACHFVQYNNSKYNNPMFLLPSLAWQLCNVFPEYKRNITIKLSGKEGKILDDMNIEGLFSVLFKEPFTNIPDPGKHFLIVIDALDESRQEERYELVDLITKHFPKFPRFVRFLITTRPEKDIARKFCELNPMFLVRNDERNLNDLRIFFKDKLKTTHEHVLREDFVKNLVEKSEGLMLYASCLCELSMESLIKSNIDSLPKGIAEIYESYFSCLESELNILGIEEGTFLLFLSLIAVAKQPLPFALIERLLCSEKDLPNARRTMLRIDSSVSSLLVVKNDCVSFFHKSVKDWLVQPNHRFTIDQEYGHKTLVDICAYQMETLKKNKVKVTFDLAMEYALRYGLPHMLQAEIQDVQSLDIFINNVTDLEVVRASVCIDIYTSLNNISNLASSTLFNTLCEKTRTTIKSLIYVIRKYTYYILEDIPQSFLQHVLNENDEELSSKASALLTTRYRWLAYFEAEPETKESIENATIGCILLTDTVLDIDISPSENFLICGYQSGGVELFSVSDLKPLWKIEDFFVERNHAVQYKYLSIKPRCIVFHPVKDVIFPGQLHRVLNLEGKFESGLFICEQTSSKFTDCCFSHDNSKMVTSYGNHLTVWNLLDNRKIIRLSCLLDLLISIMFSANDRFLATTNDRSEFCVFDIKNSYHMISRLFDNIHPVLASTFNSDSWYCKTDDGYLKCQIVKCDLTSKPVHKSFWMWPCNAKASVEFQSTMESRNLTWIHKLDNDNFFILSNERALIFSYGEIKVELFRVIALTCAIKLRPYEFPSFFKMINYISIDGRYIYTRYYRTIYINNLCCAQSLQSRKLVSEVKTNEVSFVPVTNGVFFCGEVGQDTVFGGDTPELWNFNVTQRLDSFPQVTGTLRCLSVAEDLVACIMKSQVCFFNVIKKEIVARRPYPEYFLASPFSSEPMYEIVIACSSQYHVLLHNHWVIGNSTLLLQDANIVELSSRVLSKLVPVVTHITTACFSPSGQLLAFVSDDRDNLFILDISTLKIRSEYFVSSNKMNMEFIDEEQLLCGGYLSHLCLFSIKTCNVLAWHQCRYK